MDTFSSKYTTDDEDRQGQAGYKASQDDYASFEDIPALCELMRIPHWVAYTAAKKPLDPTTGYGADANDASTWASYQRAERFWRDGGEAVGIGFELGEDGTVHVYIFIDYDHCFREDGTLEPWVAEDVRLLNSYTEHSPSGKGLHVILRGQLPGRNLGPEKRSDGMELYDHARYMTVTGNQYPGTPDTIESRPEAVAAIYARTLRARGIGADWNGANGANGAHAGDSGESRKTGEKNTVLARALAVLRKRGPVEGPDSDGQYMCRCPAHDDHNPSFSIRAASLHDGIIVHCFAGCEYDAILKKLGLTHAEASGYQAGTLEAETPLDVLVDQVADALAKANDPARGEPQVYQRGRALVQVRYDSLSARTLDGFWRIGDDGRRARM
jgi:hypothetical protein